MSAAGFSLVSRHCLNDSTSLSTGPPGTARGGCDSGHCGPAAVAMPWTAPMMWPLCAHFCCVALRIELTPERKLKKDLPYALSFLSAS